jgi:hypothetical protein
MAASLIAVIKEESRRLVTGDDRYYKSMPYYFKLITDSFSGPTGWDGTALFPLPMAPEEIEYSLPFATAVDPLQEGGVSVDEAGVVVARLRIAGTTGFKLRKALDSSFAPGNNKWSGLLPNEESSFLELSGQMHLWRLLGRCFDSYGELKKVAELAPKTYLEWHNVKDQVHQLVVPKQIDIKRNKSSERVIYRYDMTFDVIGTAERNAFEEQMVDDEDGGLIQSIVDTVNTVRKTIRQIGAAIDEITAAFDSIRRFVSNVAGIIDDVRSVVDAASDFVDGAKRFISVPAEFIGATADLVDAADDLLNDAADDDDSLEAALARRSFAQVSDALDTIKVAAMAAHRLSFDEKVDRYSQKMRRFENWTDQQSTAAESLKDKADSSGGTMGIKEAMGGDIKAGDSRRSGGEDDKPGIQRSRWNGFREVTVQQGDTIYAISIRHLGSATYWQDIAIINQLRAPYIASGARIPGTKVPGDPIVVPVNRRTKPARVVAPGNREEGGSQVSSFFGKDVRLEKLANNKYGWLVDIAHGSEDVLLVSGVDNLVQGLGSRMRTEKRHDLCFPAMGLPRIVGNRSIGELWMEARIAVQQETLADPRIEAVSGMEFTVEQDVLTINVNARPIGYDTNRTLPLTVS